MLPTPSSSLTVPTSSVVFLSHTCPLELMEAPSVTLENFIFGLSEYWFTYTFCGTEYPVFPALSVADAQIQYSLLSLNFPVSVVSAKRLQPELCARLPYSLQPVTSVTFPLAASVVIAVLADI